MPYKPKSHKPYRAPTAQPEQRGNSAERGYNWRWRRARKVYLANNRSCVECFKQGRGEKATIVDHVIPHRMNDNLFWDETNWQPLCETCHNRKTGGGR